MDTLTPRQQRVYDLLQEGRRVTEIADDMGITRNAVYGMIARIRDKGLLPEDYTASGRPPRAQSEYVRSGSPVVVALIEEVRECADSLAQVEARLRSLTR